jgi:cellulose synthase/poly-beta-1,6-N-acetylglucosamine synthase-like glycosyltransferase
MLESSPGVLAGVGLYWRFEKLVRRAESRLDSMVGATGAIAAVRRGLFEAIPPGTLLDDVYWPLRVVMRGYRVVHDSRARAYDRLPERVRDEFRRKVRTLTGNFQLLARLPGALLPWRNRIWGQYLSHKVFRLLLPWALLVLLATSAVLPGPFYAAAFWAQAGFYGLALAGLSRAGSRLRLPSAAGSVVVLNAAAWLAFWKWALGQACLTWDRVAYPPGVPSARRGD